MKRSMTVSLVLLGSAALGLSACKPKAESYQSVEACEEAGQHSDQECRDAFATAQREHEANAKHYQSREECLAAYGPNGCEERRAEGGGSFFMPMMMGYMLGRGFGYHPLYQDPNRNGTVAPGGTRFSSYSGGGGGGGWLVRGPDGFIRWVRNQHRIARRLRRIGTCFGRRLIMLRETSVPRPDWREKCEASGFTFHSMDGIPYWDESVRFRFTLDQIENAIEAPTQELLALCYAAVDDLVNDEQALARLAIPRDFWQAIAESWRQKDRDLYGRFDLAYDGQGPAKLLEFNADTPTALLESAVVQWQWLEDLQGAGRLSSQSDQYNSIHERLIAALGQMGIDRRLHLSAIADNEEDQATILYLADCVAQAGLEPVIIPIEQIGVDARSRFTDLQDNVIRALFKLYPWEWMAHEAFGRYTLTRPCQFIEPLWKMVLSNKGLCAELWRLNPGHPNLLPAFHEGDAATSGLGFDVVRKPLLSREGANIEIRHGATVVAATGGPYDGPAILQAKAPVFTEQGRTAVLGSWVVAGQACGLCIREEDGAITTNRARFIPHYIQD